MVVFSLRGWSPCIPTEFHVFDGTLLCFSYSIFRIQDLYLLWFIFPDNSTRFPKKYLQSWALSFSLAATKKIEFSFSSSGYLDVSVLRVFLLYTYVFSIWYMTLHHVGFPIRIPTGHSLLQLSVVFVRLRPSSAPCAKAFTLRSFLFDQKYFIIFNCFRFSKTLNSTSMPLSRNFFF